MIKQELCNINLFKMEGSLGNPKYKELFDEFISIEPDKLSRRGSPDVLYKSKGIS